MRVSQTTGTPETATSHVFVVVEPLLSVCRGGLFHVRAAAGGGGRAMGVGLGPVGRGLDPPGRYPVETLEPCAASGGRPRCAVEAGELAL